jgi:uncharacterized protein
MIRSLFFVSMLLGILLMGCSQPTTAKPTSIPLVAPSPTASPSGQQLPISAQAIVPNGTIIKLEVARTSEQQAMGLMHRTALPDDRGMLFPFPSPQPVSFWMKNVPVALDMVFLRKGIVQAIANAPPCASEPCPTYGPRTPIDMVIELRSGRATELGLKKGDNVKINFIESATLRR